MKNIFIAILLMAAAINLKANYTKCCSSDTTFSMELGVLKMDLAETLIEGIWTKKVANVDLTTTLQFNNAGLVGILSTATEGTANFDHKYWHLEGFSENIYLILTDMNNDKSETFLLNKMPFGIAMTDVDTGKQLDLHHTSLAEIEKMNITQKSLVGEWSSAIHYLSDTQEKREVTFHYDLKNDGTFERSVERFGYEVRSEKGFWQIAPTGDYLVLHFNKKNDLYITKFAKIKYLAFDELVLDAFFTDADLEQEITKSSVVKTLFFNKG